MSAAYAEAVKGAYRGRKRARALRLQAASALASFRSRTKSA